MNLTLPRRNPRRPSLTPMIDVVFLLLVFFMLASRFGVDRVLELPLSGAGADWAGPPRLVDISPAGLRLNGADIVAENLPNALMDLVENPSDPVVLRGKGDATLEAVVRVAEQLRAAGFTALVLVE